MFVLWIILALLALLIAVLLIRTALFKPAAEETGTFEEVPVDSGKAIANLQKLVRCRTESFADHSMEKNEEFEKLVSMLPDLYPHVFQTCTFERLPERELLFHWKGKSDKRASVLMAHYDVVPVEEENWKKPPFEAIIEDGVMWGRGTLDTKVTFNGILTAADSLIAKGFVPKEDIYMAFSGQEEINGLGATMAVKYFRDHNIELSMVVDEGGAVVQDIFPGVKEPCAMIGIAEKGLLNVTYTCKSQGGHASAPKPGSPVPVLAEAVTRVEKNPMPIRLSEPVAKMFDTLGRRSSFGVRLIFANLWLFKPVLDKVTQKSGGELNALLRTTVAFTQTQASKANNVIPPYASVVSNIRIAPGDTVESVVQALKDRIGNDKVELSYNVEEAHEPSLIAPTDTDGWKRVSDAVSGTWQGSIITPYLMVQCSDSRHYDGYKDKVYKFSAMDLTAEERSLIHGNNERIRLETVSKAVEFFTRLILAS